MNASTLPNEDPDEYEESLEQMMVKYGDELTFLAYSYVKNIEVSKDIVQNVFVSAYTNLETFRGDSLVKTWLFRITINKCKDYLKSSVFKRLVLRGTWIEDKNRITASPDEILIEEERSQAIKKAVFSLKVKYREVILMRYYQDLTVSEISSILKMPEMTVRTRIRRAKQQLEKLIEMEGLSYD